MQPTNYNLFVNTRDTFDAERPRCDICGKFCGSDYMKHFSKAHADDWRNIQNQITLQNRRSPGLGMGLNSIPAYNQLIHDAAIRQLGPSFGSASQIIPGSSFPSRTLNNASGSTLPGFSIPFSVPQAISHFSGRALADQPTLQEAVARSNFGSFGNQGNNLYPYYDVGYYPQQGSQDGFFKGISSFFQRIFEKLPLLLQNLFNQIYTIVSIAIMSILYTFYDVLHPLLGRSMAQIVNQTFLQGRILLQDDKDLEKFNNFITKLTHLTDTLKKVEKISPKIWSFSLNLKANLFQKAENMKFEDFIEFISRFSNELDLCIQDSARYVDYAKIYNYASTCILNIK